MHPLVRSVWRWGYNSLFKVRTPKIAQQIPFMPQNAAGWAGYFLTLFSLLLPAYSLILAQLGQLLHRCNVTVLAISLSALYLALFAAIITASRLSRRFPVRGAVALGISLLLLLPISYNILAYEN